MSYFLNIAQIIIPTTPVPGATPGLTLAEVIYIFRIIGSFLTTVGALLAFIIVIISGIIYMRAGSDTTKITNSQTWFRNALIGGLIVLGANMIINTLANIVTRQFFCTLQISVPFFQRCIF